MFMPTGYVWSSTGVPSTSVVKQKIGGVMLGVTDATATTSNDSVITKQFTFSSGAVPPGFVTPKKKTVAGVYNAIEARTSGNFAFNNDRGVIANATTSINGVSNNSILFMSNPTVSRRNIKLTQFGALTNTAHRLGHFNELGIPGQRNSWSTQPSANTGEYFLPTNNTSKASDEAMFVTYKAVPGELVVFYGAPKPTGLKYSAK